MAIFYMDTSALVKRYWPEQGTDAVDEIFGHPAASDRLVTSFLTILEATSAVHRLTTSGRFADALADEILARVRRDLEELVTVWPLDNVVGAQAIQVIEQHRLRSADAIHVATALAIASADSGRFLVMVSADREMCSAARSAGLRVLNPLEHDAIKEIEAARNLT